MKQPMCPKCLSTFTVVSYVTPRKPFFKPVLLSEHLRVDCRFCGYSWTEMADDNESVLIPNRIGGAA